MEFFRYKGVELSTVLDRIPSGELDSLPFGLIKLDTEGKVLEYNMTESAMTGRDPSQVLHRNFFTDVAPCTKTPEFYGKFVEGVQSKFLNTVFEYCFDHEMAPITVKVHMVMMKGIDSSHVWLIIKRIAAPSA